MIYIYYIEYVCTGIKELETLHYLEVCVMELSCASKVLQEINDR